jgi:hypothetical protein
MQARRLSRTMLGSALLALSMGACTGVIRDGGADTSGGAGGSSTQAGWPAFGPIQSFQLRRLTNEQYLATVQTLLGVSTDGVPSIEPVPSVRGFPAIGASTVAVSGAGVAKFENAARFLAQAAFGPTGPRQKLLPCTPSGPADQACITSFVTAFGRRAFRRPLSADEVTAYAALASQVAAGANDVWTGLEALVSAFLQSPSFLYLSEVGAPDPDNPSRYRLTDYEMASRLSYFLTNNMPDDALLDAAAAGALSTVEGVRAQASRLAALPAAHDTVGAFFVALLALDGLTMMTRIPEAFPKFTPTLAAAMQKETLLGVDDLVFARDGSYRTLFDQPTTFVNAELAALYGVPAPPGTGFQQVTLPPGRAGLLGQAGVLAARDHADATSPTRRGLFVLTRLLCQDLPLAPPANLAIPPAPTGRMTARQRLEMHAQNPTCASCHSHTDPVGLSLEHFDAIGAYRDTDNGLAIDDTGKLDDASFQGLLGLAAVLRDHPALGPCLIQSFYHVSIGRVSNDFDKETFRALVDGFQTGGARIAPLLAAIAASDGFRYVPPGGSP